MSVNTLGQSERSSEWVSPESNRKLFKLTSGIDLSVTLGLKPLTVVQRETPESATRAQSFEVSLHQDLHTSPSKALTGASPDTKRGSPPVRQKGGIKDLYYESENPFWPSTRHLSEFSKSQENFQTSKPVVSNGGKTNIHAMKQQQEMLLMDELLKGGNPNQSGALKLSKLQLN